MGQRTKSKIRDILESYVPEPLTDAMNAQIDEIIKKAEARN